MEPSPRSVQSINSSASSTRQTSSSKSFAIPRAEGPRLRARNADCAGGGRDGRVDRRRRRPARLAGTGAAGAGKGYWSVNRRASRPSASRPGILRRAGSVRLVLARRSATPAHAFRAGVAGTRRRGRPARPIWVNPWSGGSRFSRPPRQVPPAFRRRGLKAAGRVSRKTLTLTLTARTASPAQPPDRRGAVAGRFAPGDEVDRQDASEDRRTRRSRASRSSRRAIQRSAYAMSSDIP